MLAQTHPTSWSKLSDFIRTPRVWSQFSMLVADDATMTTRMDTVTPYNHQPIIIHYPQFIAGWNTWRKKTGWWLTYPSETYESQLVWWNSQYMETWNSCSKPPTSHILVVYIHQFRENHQPTLSICSWKVHTTLVVTVIHAAVSFNQLLTAAVADSCWLWPWQIGKFPLKRWLLSLWEFSRWMQMV